MALPPVVDVADQLDVISIHDSDSDAEVADVDEVGSSCSESFDTATPPPPLTSGNVLALSALLNPEEPPMSLSLLSPLAPVEPGALTELDSSDMKVETGSALECDDGDQLLWD